jgi:hypothetical protein
LGSKNAPIPASMSTFRPSGSRTSIERHARRIRFWSSGAAQRDQSARGALPNIDPPSSRCVFPSRLYTCTTAVS